MKWREYMFAGLDKVSYQQYKKMKQNQWHISTTWYLRLFCETMCLAFTCTAFTAFKEESTIPLVRDPITPDCAGVEPLSALSADADEGIFSPSPLARREKVNFSAFIVFESCCVCVNFRLLAQADMAGVDGTEDEPCAELSFSETTEGEDPTSEP